MSEPKVAAPTTGAVRASFASIDLSVGGIKVTAADAVLIVDDINEGMRNVAAAISWWGKVWAEAENERIQAEASYRHWRGRQILEIGGKDKGGPPEYKVMAALESDETFLRLKYALGKAERNVVICKTQYESFQEKARQLQSIGARDRLDLEAGRRDTTRSRVTRTGDGITSEELELDEQEPNEDDDRPVRVSAEKVERGLEKMRETFSKKNKAKKV